MKNTPAGSVSFLLLLLAVCSTLAQQSDLPKRSTPKLTTEDVRTGSSRRNREDEKFDNLAPLVDNLPAKGAANDIRAQLKNAFTRLSSVTSLRTKILLTGGPGGREETLFETVRPNRLHIQNDLLETIVIGNKVYTRIGSGDWKNLDTPVPKQQIDPQNFMTSLLSSPDVMFKCRILGKTLIDNIPTVVYEMTDTEGNGAHQETVLIWIGEADQMPRKIKISKPDSPVQMIFSYSAFNAVTIIAPL